MKESLKSVEISLKSFYLNQIFYEEIEPIVLNKDFFGLLIIDNQFIDSNNNYISKGSLNPNDFIEVLRVCLKIQFSINYLQNYF